jgi:hypothetical protein
VTPLYRYVSDRWLDGFVRHGELLFRALSYYRDFEDDQIRGDDFEGTRVYQPDEGIQISNLTSGSQVRLPHAFESTADQDNIFVYCLSTELSPELAKRFNASACIEIQDPEKFISMVRAEIPPKYKIQAKQLVHGSVYYYTKQEPPIVDWAVPCRIALSKQKEFDWQSEYRLAFAVGNAFGIE